MPESDYLTDILKIIPTYLLTEKTDTCNYKRCRMPYMWNFPRFTVSRDTVSRSTTRASLVHDVFANYKKQQLPNRFISSLVHCNFLTNYVERQITCRQGIIIIIMKTISNQSEGRSNGLCHPGMRRVWWLPIALTLTIKNIIKWSAKLTKLYKFNLAQEVK